MDYLEQKSYGKKISRLLKKEVGDSFGMKFQGSPQGKVAIMVITGSNIKFVGKMKTYLWINFHLKNAKINGHGNVETTIVINMTEQTQDSFDQINERMKKIFPEKVETVVLVEKITIPSADKLDNKPDEKRKVVSDMTKCRLSTTSFLLNMFDFEKKFNGSLDDSKDYFYYESDKDLESRTLVCKDESVAEKVEIAMRWLIGDNDSALMVGNQVMISFAKMIIKGRKPVGGTFCLPPNEHTNVQELSNRLYRINYSATPVITIAVPGGYFIAHYSRAATTEKIHHTISLMGWNSKISSEDSRALFIYHKQKSVENIDETPVDDKGESKNAEVVISQVEKSPTVFTLKKEEPAIVQKEAKETAKLNNNGIVKKEAHVEYPQLVKDQHEALLELEKLFTDKRLFSRLSIEVQEEVTSVLKRNYIEIHTEEYTKNLLAFFAK